MVDDLSTSKMRNMRGKVSDEKEARDMGWTEAYNRPKGIVIRSPKNNRVGRVTGSGSHSVAMQTEKSRTQERQDMVVEQKLDSPSVDGSEFPET